MARPRRNLPDQTAPPQPLNGQLPAKGRAGAESELDEYIHLGETQVEEEDLFPDIPDEAEEDDAAPIPRIERDTKLEEEIEREKYVPIEKLIEDVPELGQSLDPVRMYLSDIGRHPLLSAEEENNLARRIHEGEQAVQRMKAWGIKDVKLLLKVLEEKERSERELADLNSVDTEEQADYDEVMAQLRQLNTTGYFDTERVAAIIAHFKPAKLSDHKSIAGAVRDLQAAMDDLAALGVDEPSRYLELARVSDGLEAHRRLAQSNLRLVVSVAKRYIGRGLNFLDLIQEGNLGLLRAVDKFDHTLGYKFSTYATWWIRQAISRAIADQARTIRIPVHMVETINRQARIQRRLQQELGREPTFEELALEMEFLEPDDVMVVREALANDLGMDLDVQRRLERASAKVRRIQRLSQEPLSLETPVGNEETSSLGDFIEDDSLPGPVDTASRRLLREQMNEILEGLNERERKVLMMRFGLEDGIPRTLEDVGKEFNVTRERVRQIEAKALRKLRHPLRSRKLRDYLA